MASIATVAPAAPAAAPGSTKPRQRLSGLWNINIGFFGIQIGFALQNANMSRIFQSLGESLDDLPVLWIAAPLTGLLVQPLIGHMSDRTWGRFGRRRPYFLAGALLAAMALVLMPLSGLLIAAALLLWVLDANLNVAMEPFRAFVGDMLPKQQMTAGYAVQTACIGAGAVIGSLVPWGLAAIGVGNEGPGLPDTVRWSFWLGAAALLAAVLWTVLTTREYSPAELAGFGEVPASSEAPTPPASGSAPLWIAAGIAIAALVAWQGLEKELYLLGGLVAGYGVAILAARALARAGHPHNPLCHIVGDFAGMPLVMKRLALAQFFSWSALFIMWIYTTPVVAQHLYGAAPGTPAYNDAGNWVGVLFAIYNGVAALAALLLLPALAARIGKVRTHALCLVAGAAGFAAFFVIRDPEWLILAEIGIGIAWASILAMPYAILAAALPQAKLGIYMGLFNIFIVVPQLLVATVMGTILKGLFPAEPIWTLAFAAGSWLLAALATLRVEEA